MAHKYPEFVRETTMTNGLGNIVLGGAVSGYFSVGSSLEDGDTAYFTITGGGQTEIVKCAYVEADNELERLEVVRSTNGDDFVDFAGGEKTVIATATGASFAVFGLPPADYRETFGENPPRNKAWASAEINPAGPANKIVVEAVAAGAAANDYSIELIEPVEADAALAFEWVGNKLSISLAKASGVLTSTASDVVEFCNDEPTISDVILLSVVPDASETYFSAFSLVSLAGGDVDVSAEVVLNPPARTAYIGNAIRVFALTPGAAGNDYSIEVLDPGMPSQTLGISVDGTQITVTLGTDASGAIISAASNVIEAINSCEDIFGVIQAEHGTDEDTPLEEGSGVMSPMAETFLEGGEDPTVAGGKGSRYTALLNLEIYVNAGTEEDPDWRVMFSILT